MSDSVVVQENVANKIVLVRGQKVVLDFHLAELYAVSTKRLNEQVRRNSNRFPPDFMFQLTKDEYDSLRSHFATIEKGRGQHRKYLPLVFTEQGVAMLSSVLTSDRAIEVNIAIMRAFVQLRELLATNKELARKLDELEKKYDKQFAIVFDAIRKLMQPPDPPKRQIGFLAEDSKVRYRYMRR